MAVESIDKREIGVGIGLDELNFSWVSNEIKEKLNYLEIRYL